MKSDPAIMQTREAYVYYLSVVKCLGQGGFYYGMALRPKSSLKKYLTKPKENGRETLYVTSYRGVYFLESLYLVHILHGAELANGEDGLHVGRTTGGLHRYNLPSKKIIVKLSSLFRSHLFIWFSL